MLPHQAFIALDCLPMLVYAFGVFFGLIFKVFCSWDGFFLEAYRSRGVII